MPVLIIHPVPIGVFSVLVCNYLQEGAWVLLHLDTKLQFPCRIRSNWQKLPKIDQSNLETRLKELAPHLVELIVQMEVE